MASPTWPPTYTQVSKASVPYTDPRVMPALWMNCAGGTVLYPSDGFGGSDATAGNSILLASTRVIVVGILVRGSNAAAARTITLATHAGTTLLAMQVAPLALYPIYIPLELPVGSGIRAGSDNADTPFSVFFKPLDG